MRVLSVIVISLACVMPAFGQAQNPDDLQPGVNTSAMPPQPKPAAASTPAKAGAPAAGGKASQPGKAMDHLDLDTTQITGNKELPKVMYVVPWKRSDLGDLTGKPANSLVDEVLQPVDRDVFNREERYYHTVAAQKAVPAPEAGTPAAH